MKKRIMIVDDVAYTLQLEEDILKQVEKELAHEFEIVSAQTIGEAIEHIDSGVFDLIISDINLPDGSGEAIAKRASQKLNGTAIVALTMYPESCVKERAYFDVMLKKPIIPSTFKSNLHMLLA